jgi:hypothetical protein
LISAAAGGWLATALARRPAEQRHAGGTAGWVEPGQAPEFDEYTLVPRGTPGVKHRGGALDAQAGQAVPVRRGEWVRYGTPGADGAEYVAVRLPAFSPATAHRDEA